MMLSVDLRSLSRQGALILPGGGPLGTESVLVRLSVLEDTALSCVRSLSLGASRCLGPAWACSAVGEQMGEVWNHFRLLAEYAPGGVRSVTLRGLTPAGGSLMVTGLTAAGVFNEDSCRERKGKKGFFSLFSRLLFMINNKMFTEISCYIYLFRKYEI